MCIRDSHGWVAGRDPVVRVVALGKVLSRARWHRLADAVSPRKRIHHLGFLRADPAFGNSGE
eukprot:14130149-Alexandrium_andersonii.AAC.1